MKHKYLFIHCADVIKPTTLWVTLWIGDSQRDKKLLQFFQQISAHSDFFFRKWSADVVAFRDRVAASFYPNLDGAFRFLRSVALDARQLFDVLTDGYPGRAKHTYNGRDFAHFVQSRVAAKRCSLTAREKNLSMRVASTLTDSPTPDDFYTALAGFVWVAAVLLLDYFVSVFINPSL